MSKERAGICTKGVVVSEQAEGQRQCKEGSLDLIRESAGSSRAEVWSGPVAGAGAGTVMGA